MIHFSSTCLDAFAKMSLSVVQYVDVDVSGPDVIKVSSSVKGQTPSNTSHSIMFNVGLTSVGRALIRKQPTILLDAIIVKGDGSATTSRNLIVVPSRPDAVPSGFYIDENGNKLVLRTFLSELNTFPMRAVAGDVYFEIQLKPGERYAIGAIRVA
jgi:hypothetical protein